VSLFDVYAIIQNGSLLFAAVFFAYRIIMGKPTKKLFVNFLKILGVGLVSSLFPFFLIGLLMGAPAVLLASIVITFMFQKELI
jgi:hypothetical protein